MALSNKDPSKKISSAAMIKAGMVRKMICSFPRSSNAEAFNEKYLAGEIELELIPQGTLADRDVRRQDVRARVVVEGRLRPDQRP